VSSRHVDVAATHHPSTTPRGIGVYDVRTRCLLHAAGAVLRGNAFRTDDTGPGAAEAGITTSGYLDVPTA
jgi:hypothetical protein